MEFNFFFRMGGAKDCSNRFQIPGVECIIDIYYINIDKKLNKNLQKHK